ncbi:hypothetical protein FO478_02425 [Heyndrickxia coagulans DSM 1 = ATCC 7050]|nr:hypothetical protein [Heyndrickxia coagulans DSM 1 = ATCC 7050]QJE33459.1 hypothetical protein HHU11_13165 [Heyndrickxia coagulans]RGR86241.1 hypothetical protein DWY22_06310 [Heyndrickxia coagulans]RGS00100.1 hypothetical protein DWY16_03055 [Heyndrickxia coagulans]
MYQAFSKWTLMPGMDAATTGMKTGRRIFSGQMDPKKAANFCLQVKKAFKTWDSGYIKSKKG